jgi:arabinogalactan endo-1,4-beta-galactosidase
MARGAEFMVGADLSALTVHEQRGAAYSDDGVPGDALGILRSHGLNYVRLRLFVEPTNDDDPTTPQHDNDPFVVNDLPYTIALAQRAKAAGAKVLLDFHYSDTWADPGKQYKPADWDALSFAALTTQVRDYTRGALAAFKSAGALPEMVQIGNEISSGMLWDDGYPWTGGSHSTGFNRLADLVAAGIHGAKEGAGAGDEPLIMVHTDKGGDWSAANSLLSRLMPRLATRNATPDVLGFSYYPKWHYDEDTGNGDVADVRTTLNNAAATYAKPVVLVETGFASRGAEFEPDFEFDVSPAGQQEFLAAMVDAVRDVPNDLGRGIVWWYAEARPTPGLSVWQSGRYGLFDQNGALLPAMGAFAGVNVPGDYDHTGVTDAADLAAWQAAAGQTGEYLRADGNNDGRVDAGDFLLWQRSLTPPPSLAVPEPATSHLAAAATLFAAGARRARDRRRERNAA